MEVTPNDDENLEVYYRVNRNVVTHPNDWIGVYDVSFSILTLEYAANLCKFLLQPEFKHVKDYVAYIWAIRIRELEKQTVKKQIFF